MMIGDDHDDDHCHDQDEDNYHDLLTMVLNMN